ncbi:hypothetical protein [Clostridium sp.]|nr:hypothetical protein [Clostridium sp.]MDR3597918.1 hypothetical protein [Clostridium sp.]
MWDKTLKEAGILSRNGDVELLKADGGDFTLHVLFQVEDNYIF